MSFPAIRRQFGRLAVICAWLLSGTASSAGTPPNFVVIFCDDLGYGDIGCFGSEKHRTPHIDRMATEGLRLTSFYSTSGVCTPSRSSLMTGCYPKRVGMHADARDRCVLFPRGKQGLAPRETTVAEVLKEANYATICIGKWHLGDQPQFLPTRHGFDHYFGIPYSNDMQHKGRGDPPLPLVRDERVVEAPADQATLTRRYTEEAVRFIRKHSDRPFFLYLPHTMPHNPVHASEAFRGRSANGRYGDAVEEIDASTGAILAALKEAGIDERTLVLFTSDNGAASRWGGSNGPLRGWKGTTWEGGQRVPCVVRWPGNVPAGSSSDALVTTMDLLPTFASLAGASVPSQRPIDGVDVSAVLRGGESPREVFLYYQMDQLQALRDRRWKLHLPLEVKQKNWGKPSGGAPLQLFDLEHDVAESRNVAEAHPEVVARLLAAALDAMRDLGDADMPGPGQRAPGRIESPEPLVLRNDDGDDT